MMRWVGSANLDRFLARLGEASEKDLPDRAALTPVLERAVATAREAWPDFAVSDGAFIDHLADHHGSQKDAASSIAAAHVADLYLALACAEGEVRAILAFEADILPSAAIALQRLKLPPDTVDELRQRLRNVLFVPGARNPSLVLQYSGRGSLRAWIRVAAIRQALTWQRTSRREQVVDDLDLLDAAEPDLDPELVYMKALYRREFTAAFQSALAALDPKQRTVLRLHVLDGLNIGEIGSIYAVHRATVARWIAASRAALLEETRRAMSDRLDISDGEFDSLLRLVESQLDISLTRFLAGDDEASGKSPKDERR
jgi:RNA polymerase sigma-70 factor (ECF subfamily)